MPDIITLTGVVATPPNTVKTDNGLIITHFRLASSSRRFDAATQSWVDGETNFYSISAFRQTAHNVFASLGKGDRVVVTGRLKLKEWTTGDRRGLTAEVDAESLGHDLAWGSSQYTKVSRSTGGRVPGVTEDRFPSQDEASAAEGGGDSDGRSAMAAPAEGALDADGIERAEFGAVSSSIASAGIPDAYGEATRNVSVNATQYGIAHGTVNGSVTVDSDWGVISPRDLEETPF